jgi:hypothetical protein
MALVPVHATFSGAANAELAQSRTASAVQERAIAVGRGAENGVSLKR